MAKRKDSEGLFEIISRTKSTQGASPMEVPEWMSRKPGQQPHPTAEAEQAPPPPTPRAEPTESPGLTRAILSLREARVTMSLNYVSCGVIILALLTLLIGMFVLGRRSAIGRGRVEGSSAPYSPGVLGKKGQERITTRSAAAARVAGKYYMVIEGLGGITPERWDDAKSIVEFCKKANLPADIGQMRNPRQYVVWSLTGLGSADSPEAVDYAQQIKELGQKYKDKYGTYDFIQTDPVGNWPWFHQYRPVD